MIAKLWQVFNKKLLFSAERIICIGRDMKRILTSSCPVCIERIRYIPNWQNEDLIKHISFSENTFIKEHNLHDKFVIQYSGNMGLWHDMKPFAELAKYFENKNVSFCFIGDGMRKKEMFEVWVGQIPSNTLFLPFQNSSNLAMTLTACHVGLISLREGLEGIAVPCKLYGILAGGTPILAQVPIASEIALVVKEENCGIVVEPGNFQGLVNAVNYLKENEDIRFEMGRNARLAFEQKYTLKTAAENYYNLIKEIYES